jgi:hypothetical protein
MSEAQKDFTKEPIKVFCDSLRELLILIRSSDIKLGKNDDRLSRRISPLENAAVVERELKFAKVCGGLSTILIENIDEPTFAITVHLRKLKTLISNDNEKSGLVEFSVLNGLIEANEMRCSDLELGFLDEYEKVCLKDSKKWNIFWDRIKAYDEAPRKHESQFRPLKAATEIIKETLSRNNRGGIDQLAAHLQKEMDKENGTPGIETNGKNDRMRRQRKDPAVLKELLGQAYDFWSSCTISTQNETKKQRIADIFKNTAEALNSGNSVQMAEMCARLLNMRKWQAQGSVIVPADKQVQVGLDILDDIRNVLTPSRQSSVALT